MFIDIDIRHIDRTPLNMVAYVKLIKKFAKLKYKLIIIFDKRIKDFGQYTFNSDKRLHTIRISPKRHKANDESVEKIQLIATTLHELQHCIQKEKMGNSFWSKSYSFTKHISNNPDFAAYFSECEVRSKGLRTFKNLTCNENI